MTNQGWECPKCGAVYAPWVFKCQTCPSVAHVTISGSTAICYCPTDTAGNKIHEPGCLLNEWRAVSERDSVHTDAQANVVMRPE